MTNPPAGIEQEMVEAVARAMCKAPWHEPAGCYYCGPVSGGSGVCDMWQDYTVCARAAIRVLAPLITARERERCARFAEEWQRADRYWCDLPDAIRTPTQGETG